MLLLLYHHYAAVSACEKGGEWAHALDILGNMVRNSIAMATISGRVVNNTNHNSGRVVNNTNHNSNKNTYSNKIKNRPKMAPRGPRMAPKWTQDGPKTAAGRPQNWRLA